MLTYGVCQGTLFLNNIITNKSAEFEQLSDLYSSLTHVKLEKAIMPVVGTGSTGRLYAPFHISLLLLTPSSLEGEMKSKLAV